MLPIEADSGVAEKLLDKTSLQLRSCEVDGRVLEALLISVPGDRHYVPVWDSCIRPDGYGSCSNPVVGVEL